MNQSDKAAGSFVYPYNEDQVTCHLCGNPLTAEEAEVHKNLVKSCPWPVADDGTGLCFGCLGLAEAAHEDDLTRRSLEASERAHEDTQDVPEDPNDPEYPRG